MKSEMEQSISRYFAGKPERTGFLFARKVSKSFCGRSVEDIPKDDQRTFKKTKYPAWWGNSRYVRRRHTYSVTLSSGIVSS